MICENAQSFLDLLEEKNMQPKAVREENGKTAVIASVHSKVTKYDIVFLFDPEHMVQIMVPEILSCPQNKFLELLNVCNRQNAKFRWFKYYLTEARDSFSLRIQSDLYIDPDNSGRICMDIMLRMIRVIDEAYPEFMKTIWG